MKMHYTAPAIEEFAFWAEQGFAGSPLPDYEEDGDNIVIG